MPHSPVIAPLLVLEPPYIHTFLHAVSAARPRPQCTCWLSTGEKQTMTLVGGSGVCDEDQRVGRECVACAREIIDGGGASPPELWAAERTERRVPQWEGQPLLHTLAAGGVAGDHVRPVVKGAHRLRSS